MFFFEKKTRERERETRRGEGIEQQITATREKEANIGMSICLVRWTRADK